MSFQDLFTDTQNTSAVGYSPAMAVTQGGSWDKQLDVVVQLATKLQSSGTVEDARDWAFQYAEGLPRWTKGDATGIHAEVLIIRGWMVQDINNHGLSIEQAITALAGRTIQASQPACWCCAQLMTEYGIVYDATGGIKPRTAWRHPLSGKSVPNADIPSTRAEITSAWLRLQYP